MRIVCLGLVLAAATLVSARGPSQTDQPLQLRARVTGEGAPVVLLGDGLLGADGWGQVPDVLARTRRVFNVQSLVVQYGLEDRPLPDEYSIHTEVAALRRTLDTEQLSGIDLIGMSHGGVVAIVFALGEPSRVRSLTLIEPPAFWTLPDHGRGDARAREMQDFVGSLRGQAVREEHVERFGCLLGWCAGGRSLRQMPQWPVAVKHRNSLRGLYAVGDHKDDPARLRQLTMPALVVNGTETVAFHRAINDVLLRTLPRAEALELEGGHTSPVSAPERFVAEWQKFLQRHAARDPQP